ncbi:hypothetical protein MBLNU459_g0051t2 [Dothideomycetes sp. NU459]
MSFFQRFPAGEFAPLFRLLDDYASHQSNRSGSSFPYCTPSTQVRTFQPRFDVKEGKDAYELHGELPGIDQQDIAIEFTDPQTISIKGRTERYTESGTRPDAAAATIEDTPEAAGTVTPSESESSYHKATVEDEQAMSGAVPASEPTASNQEVTPTAAAAAAAAPAEVAQPAQPQTQTSRYWVSERSIGEFSRSFAFPTRVDQERVKASLKNGILSIVVPKAAAPTLKRINVE